MPRISKKEKKTNIKTGKKTAAKSISKEKAVKKTEPKWHFIDVKNQVLGRVSTQIAELLIGKHKPEYMPNINFGDKVVVTNASRIKVTGKKLKDKIYQRYTGYHGSVKSETLENLLKRDPRKVIERAVKGMLPRNKLHKVRMANLYIYPGPNHPHNGQKTGEEESETKPVAEKGQK